MLRAKWIDNAGVKIEFDAACECLTGNVQITAGTLDVDQNFRTTGQLIFGGTQDGLIDLASHKSVLFSVAPLAECIGGGGF